MKFRIVTPCSRPENLSAIFTSVQQFKSKTTLDVEWVIVFDKPIPDNLPDLGDSIILWMDLKGKSIVGYQQRNLALDAFTDGYVYFLDDDNILHPNLHLVAPFMNKNILILDQVDKHGKVLRIAKQKNVKVNRIDTAQFIIYRPLVQKQRFLMVYEADGIFITDLHDRVSDKFLFLNLSQGLSYYNYLR